jgi:hypothetical protein
MRRAVVSALPTTAAFLAAVILVSHASASVARAAQPPRVLSGRAVVGSVGIARTTADVMREEALHAGDVVTPAPVHEFEMPEREREMNPASPRVASVPEMPADQLTFRRAGRMHAFLPSSPQVVGLNFLGAQLSGTNSTGAFPPDNDGAVGPTQYIIAVNGRMVTYNKTTGIADGVLNATTNTFFTSVRNGSGTSDPVIRYDRLTSRWFVGMINTSSSNRFMLAVSDAASNGTISAGTVWTYFQFVPSTLTPSLGAGILSDYPTMGVDANALYTGFDEFVNSSGAFSQVDAVVIQKSSVLGAGPIVATKFAGLMSAATSFVGPWAPRGVDGVDPGQTEGYMISTDGASWGNMWLLRIANPGSITPTMTSAMYALPSENGPRFVGHLGNTGGYWGGLDPIDDRFFQATIRGQQLWTVHNLGVNNAGVSTGVYATDDRDGARWFQFNVPVNTGAPAIVQSGTVFTPTAGADSTQRNYFIPTLNVSGQGHVAMGFSAAGVNERANAATVGRLANDPLGTMETPLLLTSSSTAYNPSGDGTGQAAGRPHRWGDFSATTVDPIDDMTMWTVQQYCNGASNYGCQIVRLTAPPPATPSAMADVVVGQPAVSVTLTGVSSGGSGFFDPGPNLPSPARPFNHIGAACSNGAASGTPPTVVSVTYVNPTTATVVLNTTSATANLPSQMYTITVTNPDGQTAAGAVVHVVNTTITASAGANGSISPSGAVTVPYGTNQTFTITADPCYSIANVIVDGSSVGTPSSYTFTNVITNHTISATFAAGLTNAPSGLTATQVKTGNGPGSTTGITIAYTVPLGSTSVEVWRKGFGSYPLYSRPPGTGVAPTLPASYPPAGWTQCTGVTASGQVDSPGSRDDWYYVAYGRDGCGDVSPVSAMTGGTLDYHLGDYTDGITNGTGDNTVNTADASHLGANYGASGGALAGLEYLDVGPTTDSSTNGRPVPDGVADFEDLVMVALNYTPHVSAPARANPVTPGPLGRSGELLLAKAASGVRAGETFEVPVVLSASGELQALSVTLSWDAAIAAPAGMTPGEFVTSQGAVVLSSGPGRVDAAILGVGAVGMTGEGTIAAMRFRALADGDPRVTIGRVIGRDAMNHAVAVAVHSPVVTNAPVTATDLFPVIPNPTHGTSLIPYSLVRRGAVSLSIYSVDGRLVKTLARGVQEAGRYEITWDGTDTRGSALKSGLFYVRFEAAGVRRTRVLSVIR